MVLGFLKGKVGIKIDGVNFNAGDTIGGVATLSLKKPVTAKKMSVSLVGEEKRRTRDSDGSTSTETRTFFEEEILLDGEKEYPAGNQIDYPFQIPIPHDIKPEDIELDGVAGKILDLAKSMTTGKKSYKWYLIARLAIPMSIDITKKSQISIV